MSSMEKEPTQELFYDLWPTAWGPMGGVMGPAGLLRVVLPYYQTKDLEQLLVWEHKGARRDAGRFGELAALCRSYFNGQGADFSQVLCQLPAPETLGGKVLRACREIPYGQTQSYSQLAKGIGAPESARPVAAALGRNPIPLVVPCHRVTYAGGKLGGFSAPGGAEIKARMLALENRAK